MMGNVVNNQIDVDERMRTSRRNIVRGAAWSVPVVAVAATAPAFAASPCDTQTYTIDWGNSSVTTFTPPTNPGGSGTKVATAIALAPAGSGSASLTATFTSTVSSSNITRADDNLLLSDETNVGGLGLGRGLNLSHESPITEGYANRQTLTISFNRAVTGLNFWITDIDSTRSGSGTRRDPFTGWYDRVTLSGTYAQVRDTNLRGTGSSSDPWYYVDEDTNIGNESPGARVKVTYNGTIAANSPITLEYWSTLGGSNQRIFLSDMSWSAKGC